MKSKLKWTQTHDASRDIMMKRLQWLFRLVLEEPSVFIQVLPLLLLIRLGLRVLSFRALHRLAANRIASACALPKGDARLVNVVQRAVRTASHCLPGRSSCLAQALVTHLLLIRRGYPTHLCVGVAKTATGQLEAHAWVECQGRVVIGDIPDLARYTQLLTLP